MKSYYFYDSRKRKKLFVPFNMVAQDSVKPLYPDICLKEQIVSKPWIYLDRNRTSLERGLISIVDVPQKDLDLLRDYCFNGQMNEAIQQARDIFFLVINNWRCMFPQKRCQ